MSKYFGKLTLCHLYHPNHVAMVTTVFARSDTMATIYFIAQVCAVFIQERHLLIPVAAREAILKETVD